MAHTFTFNLFFFLKNPLALWDHLWFHTCFRTVWYIFVKEATGILVGIALSIYIALGNMDILTQ